MGLVDLLISETRGRIGALPLLQFALERVWEGLNEKAKPAETLRKIGGVGGALASEAQRIYKGLNETNKAIARRAFIDLVQLGEGTQNTRRRMSIPDIVTFGTNRKQVKDVMLKFSRPGARLITSLTADDGTEAVEITHESLIDHWSLLGEWLEKNRDDIRFQRRLDDAVRSWDAQGRPKGNLWRSPDLDLLRDFKARSDGGQTPLRLTKPELDFFDASDKAEKLEREVEKLRQKQLQLRERIVVCAGVLAIFFAVISSWFYLGARDTAEGARTQAEEYLVMSRTVTFAWFLSAWREGRTGEAEFARKFMIVGSPERKVADFLIAPDTLAAVKNLPRKSELEKAIASFALGEHHLRRHENREASKAYEDSRKAIQKIKPADAPVFKRMLRTNVIDRLDELSRSDAN